MKINKKVNKNTLQVVLVVYIDTLRMPMTVVFTGIDELVVEGPRNKMMR